jgi:hypothetical protein
MLTEAEIEIVDETGHVEDRVRIVGTGEVALATMGTAWLQLPSDAPAEVDAVITLRDGTVTIEAKSSCRSRSRAMCIERSPRSSPP